MFDNGVAISLSAEVGKYESAQLECRNPLFPAVGEALQKFSDQPANLAFPLKRLIRMGQACHKI
ncbi:MAG: hypothetical protein ABSD74_18185 [Rhizomicrobium sp.]